MSLRPIAAGIEQSARANEFVHVAKFLLEARGDWLLASNIAESRRALPNIVAILKSAVSAGSIHNSTWGSQLAEFSGAIAAFLGSLRNVGAFDAMLPNMRQIPLRTRASVVSVGATGAVVGEGQVTPVSKLQLTGKQLSEMKALVLIAINDELARLAGAEGASLFGRELRYAVAVETDRQFISNITSGISPIPTNGGTSIAILQDLAAALATIDTDAASQLFVLVEPNTAKAWATKTTSTGAIAFPEMTPQGGMICGMPALVTDGLSSSTIVVADAYQIAAHGGTIELASSHQATLQMETAPDSPPSGASALLSLFQTNTTALRAMRYFGAELLGATGVAVISGVGYSGGSPA